MAQSLETELRRQPEPDGTGDDGERQRFAEYAPQHRGERGHDGVVVPRRQRANLLPIQPRVLLEQQRVEQDLALLPDAHAPLRRAHRMIHHGFRRSDHFGFRFEERKEQVRILAPGGGESLIETADRLQRVAPHEAVRGNELRTVEMARIELVIGGRRFGQGHAHASCRGPGPGLHRPPSMLEPVAMRDRVVVGESDDFAQRHAPARIARAGRTARVLHRQIGDARSRAHAIHPSQHHGAGQGIVAIVGDDDLIRPALEVLAQQGGEAAIHEMRPAIGRDNDGDLDLHGHRALLPVKGKLAAREE